MAEIKCTINDTKTGKSYTKVLTDNPFIHKKIKDKITGTDIGLEGYELEITGGSDKAGFPMRPDVQGGVKKRILATKGIGIRTVEGKGTNVRKMVIGNTISDAIVQINMKVLKEGKTSLEAMFGKKEEQPAEA